MRTTLTIPAEAGQVDDHIEGAMIGADNPWAVAAWLAARVRLPGSGSRTDLGKLPEVLTTPEGYAAKKVKGLSDPKTVRRYVKAWLEAHDGEYPALGSTVTLPDPQTFPMTSKVDDTTKGAQKVRDIVNNTPSLVQAIKTNPKAAKAAAQALADGGAGHLDMSEAADLTAAASDHVVARAGGDPSQEGRLEAGMRWVKALHAIRSNALTYRAERAGMTEAQGRKADEKASEVIDTVVSCLGNVPADLSGVES